MKISIIFPVLNEENRLKAGILNTIKFLDNKNFFEYELIIVDNGSTDETEKISKELCTKFHKIRYIKLNQKGVGLAFREGIKNSNSDIVGYMDIDLSTDLSHLLEVYDIFGKNCDIGIINGSRLLKNSNVYGRTIKREITSRGLNLILRFFLKVKFTDAMCGFKFFRKSIVDTLIEKSSNETGWFYCAELLIRAEISQIPMKEIPVLWTDDHNSKVNIKRTTITYVKQIIKIYKEIK